MTKSILFDYLSYQYYYTSEHNKSVDLRPSVQLTVETNLTLHLIIKIQSRK